MAVGRRTAQQAAVKPVHSDASEVEDLARQVAELQRIENPWAKGATLEFTISDTAPPLGPRTGVVKHKLGRVPTGWIIVDVTTAYVVGSVMRQAWDANTLTLMAERGCSGKVLVY